MDYNSSYNSSGSGVSQQEQQDFEFLDMITIISFVMQLKTYGKNVTIHDMQDSLKSAVQEIENKIDDLDKHLARIEEMIRHEND